jgi:hypothetical protein
MTLTLEKMFPPTYTMLTGHQLDLATIAASGKNKGDTIRLRGLMSPMIWRFVQING